MIADLIERALEPIVDAMIGSSVPQVSKVGHLVCDTSAAVLSLLDDAEGKVPYVLISRKHRGAQLKTAFEAGRELGQREQLVPPPRDDRPARDTCAPSEPTRNSAPAQLDSRLGRPALNPPSDAG